MMLRKYRIAVIGHTGRGNYGHGVDTVWFESPAAKSWASPMPTKRGSGGRRRLKAPRASPITASCSTK